MADQDAQDRNLPASARKLQKAREQGQVPRSRDLGHFASITVGGAVLVAAMPWATGWLKARLVQSLQFDARTVANPQTMLERLAELTVTMMWMVLPLGLLMILVAIGVSAASGGWNFTLKPLQPKFAFLDPIGGLGRLFSKQQLIDTLKACGLALILGTIGALYLQAHVGEFAQLLGMSLPAAVEAGATTVLGGLALLVLALAAFAAACSHAQGHGGHGNPPSPPPEAYTACQGKAEGDSVTLTMPDGKTLAGTCAPSATSRIFSASRSTPLATTRGAAILPSSYFSATA